MSPYFPKEEETSYRCPGCGGYFYPGTWRCLVAHAPGTCCHKYETPAPTPDAASADADERLAAIRRGEVPQTDGRD